MLSKAAVKDIQSLQQKKFRDERNQFVAEGPKVVGELLCSDSFKLIRLYALKEWLDGSGLELAANIEDKIQEVTSIELYKIAHYATPNQMVAIFEKKHPKLNFNTKGEITLVLDDIQDPGNLGTIIRTADWFGIHNIVCSPHTVDSYNSKVVQSTMASLARVNVIYTPLQEWLKQQQGIPIVATVPKGKDIHTFSGTKEAIVIIGNESNGISQPILSMSTHNVSIPGSGRAESLNAAIATGIILYALKV